MNGSYAAIFQKRPPVKKATSKLFKCTGCFKFFANQGALGSHLKFNPTHDYTMPTFARPHQCEQCQKTFPTQQALGIHLVKAHVTGAPVEQYPFLPSRAVLALPAPTSTPAPLALHGPVPTTPALLALPCTCNLDPASSCACVPPEAGAGTLAKKRSRPVDEPTLGGPPRASMIDVPQQDGNTCAAHVVITSVGRLYDNVPSRHQGVKSSHFRRGTPDRQEQHLD